MNERICQAVSLLLVVGACAQPQPMSMQDIERCQNTNTVTISLRAVEPKPAPKHVCVAPGTSLTIRLVPRQDANTVMVFAKTTNIDGGGPGNWLTKANITGTETISINVPNSEYMIEVCGESDYNDKKCYFDYAIFAKAKLPVDPRVTVRR